MVAVEHITGNRAGALGASSEYASNMAGDQALERFAKKIADSSYREPVSFLFESHLPAFSIIYSIFLMTEPFIAPFVSSDLSLALKTLYENPEKRDWFLSEIAPSDISGSDIGDSGKMEGQT